MPEEFESERPPDESWWERELHRNEKLMDKYMAVLGDNPDWDKWKHPEDLYNKVHFDVDPPEDSDLESEEEDAAPQGVSEAEVSGEELESEDGSEAGLNEEWEDQDEDPEANEDYQTVSKLAREFACEVFDLKDVPANAELLYLSAGKVGANLAGGHGLGYDDDSICGNIVKCRWALSDCEFCREMLEQFHERTNDPRYSELIAQSHHLADLIRERIARLRKRVWW